MLKSTTVLSGHESWNIYDAGARYKINIGVFVHRALQLLPLVCFSVFCSAFLFLFAHMLREVLAVSYSHMNACGLHFYVRLLSLKQTLSVESLTKKILVQQPLCLMHFNNLGLKVNPSLNALYHSYTC